MDDEAKIVEAVVEYENLFLNLLYRGMDDVDYSVFDNGKYVKDFNNLLNSKIYQEMIYWGKRDLLCKIDEIIILGHGIEADSKAFKELFDGCQSLKHVSLYRYPVNKAVM